MFMACWDRELLLVYRNWFLYGFRTFQSVLLGVFTVLTYPKPRMPAGTQDDGNRFFSVLFFSVMILMFDGIAELNLTVRASCRRHAYDLCSPAGSGPCCRGQAAAFAARCALCLCTVSSCAGHLGCRCLP